MGNVPLSMILYTFYVYMRFTMERVVTQTEWLQLRLWSEYFDAELDLSDLPHLW